MLLLSICFLPSVFSFIPSNGDVEQFDISRIYDYNGFANLKKNLEIQLYLNKSKGASYGPTKFSHLSQKEFEDRYLCDLKLKKVPLDDGVKTTPISRFRSLSIPKKVDWRNANGKNYVSPIKNQNACGGCWAFSTTETVESMFGLKHQVTPPILSVQEVIDCAADNYGCSGGDTCTALKWLKKTQSLLVTEAKYPLTDTSDYCKLLTNSSWGVTVSNYSCMSLKGREDKMLELLANVGPLTVAVDATTWNHYLGGIIQYHCDAKLNHAVQIVGYDISGDIPFYIVRNSWGTNFGIDGYLYIKVGEDLCGIASEVSTVTVL